MAHVLEYYHEYYDIGGTLHRVELLQDGYSGGSTHIKKSDAVPVRMRHTGSKTDFEKTIIQGQELVFSFRVARDDVDTFDTLFESDYKDYKVKYYVGEELEFEGYVKPENLSKQFSKNPPYVEITLSATDALADLKNILFGDGSIINDKLTILEILKYALTPIGITLDFQIQLGTYESTYMAATECALKEIVVDARRFFTEKTGKTEILSCHEVIEAALKDFSITFKQRKGKYQITNHNELNSYQFIFDWSTLTQQSRTATGNIVDMIGYKYDPGIEQQKIRPLKTVAITHKNKDLGEPLVGVDNWNNWVIDFYSHTVLAGNVLQLYSSGESYDDYIQYTAGFTKITENDYIKITFDEILHAFTGGGIPSIKIKIEITRPDTSTLPPVYFPCYGEWNTCESYLAPAFKITASGDYIIKISFIPDPYNIWDWTTATFWVKDMVFSKIINTTEEYDLSNITYDKHYRQTSGKGIEIFETETLLADTLQVSEIGALLANGGAANTASWNTYGHTEGIRILDIYARNILNNRYNYKNYLRAEISDRNNNIDFDKILTILSKNYVCISYDRNFKECLITVELIELLTTQQDYSLISEFSLDSVDGVPIKEGVNINVVTSTTTPYHNELGGLYGASPYNHLSAAAYTNVGNLASMAYQATASYYTAAQLNAGQLNNLYYTETELNAGQLNNLYYTETEINTWRAEVTQTEMGYLHGVASDVQTQITARAIIGADAANDRIATWTGATTIKGEPNLTFDGAVLTNKGHRYQQFSTEAGKTDWRLTLANEDADLAKIFNYDVGGAAFKNMVLGNTTKLLYLDLANTRIGINRSDPAYTFDINGTGRFVGNLYGDANVQHKDFTTGFQGTNWQITDAGNGELNNLLVRGGLTVYELILNRLHYQCGGLIIGAGGGKIKTIHVATQGSEQLEFEDPAGNSILPFTVGAIVMVQDFDLNRTTIVKKIVRQVASITGQVLTLTTTAGWVIGDDVGAFAYGDEVLAIGHVSNAALDASLYFSATDSDNPFCRVFDGVDSYAKWSLGDKTTIKMQWGNLASLAGYDIVPADPGYGFYSDNVFLKGKIVATLGEIGGWTISSTALTGGANATTIALTPATGIHMGNAVFADAPFSVTNAGVLKAISGTIGGWTLASDALYTGTKYIADDWSATGITLANDGAIHTPNFYVNTNGEIGLRQVESVLFKTDINNLGIKIAGGHIWENEINSDIGYITINNEGHNGTMDHFRQLQIYNGKGAMLAEFSGYYNKVKSYVLLESSVNIIDGYAAYFFNDGNQSSRYGIGIQYGKDIRDGVADYPIRFYDGDGGLSGYILSNDTDLTLTHISDISLKENIKDYTINGLDIIDQLQYRSFNLKKNPDKDRIVHGWIADEVEKFLPEMVSVDPETGLKTISQTRLIPVLVASVKELKKKIKILEAQKN